MRVRPMYQESIPSWSKHSSWSKFSYAWDAPQAAIRDDPLRLDAVPLDQPT
jgi:hypothetical protein